MLQKPHACLFEKKDYGIYSTTIQRKKRLSRSSAGAKPVNAKRQISCHVSAVSRISATSVAKRRHGQNIRNFVRTCVVAATKVLQAEVKQYMNEVYNEFRQRKLSKRMLALEQQTSSSPKPGECARSPIWPAGMIEDENSKIILQEIKKSNRLAAQLKKERKAASQIHAEPTDRPRAHVVTATEEQPDNAEMGRKDERRPTKICLKTQGPIRS